MELYYSFEDRDFYFEVDSDECIDAILEMGYPEEDIDEENLEDYKDELKEYFEDEAREVFEENDYERRNPYGYRGISERMFY